MDSIEVVATGILLGKTSTTCKNINKLRVFNLHCRCLRKVSG